MDHLIYTAMTGATAAAHRQAVLSNNLANVSTNGFRAEMATYRAVPLRGDGATTRVFALEATSGHSDLPGSAQRTGRSLDAMAKGNAWFAVQGLDGTEAYTRNGSFEVSPDGTLVTGSGLTVLSDGGAPVTVPPNSELAIGDDGSLSAKVPGQRSSVIGRLKYDAAFTIAHYVRVFLDVLEGLAYAHNLNDLDGSPLNLVHRDISPHNILVTFDGQTKVVDFGIAKAANSMVETRTGVIKGKVTYMAPEQAFSAHVDCTADLYAIGVMLWEAVAQRRRWKGLSSGHVLQKLAMKDMPEPAGAVARGLPAELDEICTRALAVEPSDRFKSADEMATALRKVFNKLDEQPTARQVGVVISKEFEKERAQRKHVIEERLRIAQTEAVTSLPIVAPPPSSITETSNSPMGAPTRASASVQIAEATTGKNRSSALLLAGAGILLVAR